MVVPKLTQGYCLRWHVVQLDGQRPQARFVELYVSHLSSLFCVHILRMQQLGLAGQWLGQVKLLPQLATPDLINVNSRDVSFADHIHCLSELQQL